MKNKKIRIMLAVKMVKMWQLAKIMGISEMTLYRRFRDELPEAEQDRICRLIDDYVEKGGIDHE